MASAKEKVGLWFKRLGFAGALRWRMLYWVYRLWPGLHIRDREWDFVLDYLPALRKGQKANVLIVGCTSSLFIYEVIRRGYFTWGIDKRPYQEELKGAGFFEQDITEFDGTGTVEFFKDYVQPQRYDFVVCISVLEHIDKQQEAMSRMADSLMPNGKLLLTIPTKIFAQDHDFQGFDYPEFRRLASRFYLVEYTERKGQICACLVRA